MAIFVFLYTTFPDGESAAQAARALVSARLVACANIVPGMRAIYRYEDRIEEGQEVIVIFKLPASLKIAAASMLRSHHPYATPVVAFLDVEPDLVTANWLTAQTDADQQL